MNKILLGTLSLAVAATLNAGVLAVVNGEKITDKSINEIMQSMGGHMDYSKLPENTRKKLLNQVIDRKLLGAEAAKSGVEKTSEFKKALEKTKKELAYNMWMKKRFDSLKVSDAEAKKFYNKNASKYMQPARAKARHILLKTEKDAKAVIAQLKGLSGKKLESKFIELAKSKSTGPSAKNGGELGWFGEKQMVPAFSKAAFKLKKGQITTKPVKTNFGYHVIYKEDAQKAQKVDFAKVKEGIKNGMKVEQFKTKLQDEVKALRKKAKIEFK